MLEIRPQPSGHAFEALVACVRCGASARIWLHEVHAMGLVQHYGDYWPVAALANLGWRTEPDDYVLCPPCLKNDERFETTERTPKPDPAGDCQMHPVIQIMAGRQALTTPAPPAPETTDEADQ
jgi:hypothetical protein